MGENQNVYIIDDDEEVLESLRWLMESVDYQTHCFTNAQAFLDVVTDQWAGCIVLDIRMPGMSGLELQEEINRRKIILPIIFITGHGDIPMAVRAMKNGATDFLCKPVNNQILLETINKAISFDENNRKKMSSHGEYQARAERLTHRELEVMTLMSKGLLTKHIASSLEISPNTVELHRAKVMKKMQAKGIGELVNMVIRNNLVPELA